MKAFLFAAALAAVASPALADVVFEDIGLNPADYRTTVYAAPGVTTQVYSDAGAGPVGTAIFSRYTGTFGQFQNTNAPRFQFMNDSFVYDPSTQGAIDTIQVSMDQFLYMTVAGVSSVNLSTTTRHLRLLAEQGGVLYEAVAQTGGAYSPQWLISAVNGLVSTDFKVFDVANPWAARTATGLDFAGGAITFGFELTHYALQPAAIPDDRASLSAFGVDNLQIVLRTLDPVDPGVPGAVPEPATWAMMIVGFGLAGSAVRRRRTLAA